MFDLTGLGREGSIPQRRAPKPPPLTELLRRSSFAYLFRPQIISQPTLNLTPFSSRPSILILKPPSASPNCVSTRSPPNLSSFPPQIDDTFMRTCPGCGRPWSCEGGCRRWPTRGWRSLFGCERAARGRAERTVMVGEAAGEDDDEVQRTEWSA